MTDVNLGPANMMRGKCSCCDWEFDLIALPMEVSRATVATSGAYCPMCGAPSSKIMVGKPRDLTPEEQAHKTRVQAEEAASRKKAKARA